MADYRLTYPSPMHEGRFKSKDTIDPYIMPTNGTAPKDPNIIDAEFEEVSAPKLIAKD